MNIIIVGCGKVGSGLALQLAGQGHNVTVVDRNEAARKRLGANFHGRFIAGVEFDREVLLQAGIETADGLAATSPDDETNIVVANIARRFFHVPNVVARIANPAQADVFSRLGMQTVAPTNWTIQRTADILTHATLQSVLTLGGGEMDVMCVDIPPALVGHGVRELNIINETQVIAVVRHGRALFPTSGLTLEPGDCVYVAAMSSGSDQLQQMVRAG